VHYPLRPAGGTGRVEDHRQAVRRRIAAEIGRRQPGIDVVEAEQGSGRPAQLPRKLGVARIGDDQPRAAIVEHVRQPIGRVARVEHDVELSCLQDGEDGGEHVRTMIEQQHDWLRRVAGPRDDRARQPVRRLVQRAVVVAPVFVDDAGRSPNARACCSKRCGIDCSISASANERKGPGKAGMRCRSFMDCGAIASTQVIAGRPLS
jgi:hypothetical protein